MHYLTYAEVRDQKQIQKLTRFSGNPAIFSNILKSSNAKFFLIIYADGKQFVRMNLYPIAENAVIKVTIEGEKISNQVLEAVSSLSTRMHVIHTSGFANVQNHMVYEMYIAKTAALQKFDVIRAELAKLGDIKKVNVQEIDLQHTSMVDLK